ncbi:MAG TPA: hypothetical protein VFN64_10530 [Burkholderiaceae bacterium]|nr:hypothetical protein [Burkholderiaceae bacterium]
MHEAMSRAFTIRSGPSMNGGGRDPRLLLSEKAVKHVSTFHVDDLDRRNGAARARIRGLAASDGRNPLTIPVTMRSVLSN